ncbi:unnamed protein product [Protopolystoma xenopodis]|uniref:Uncharacterized protein n=1 Tax=Protopolystoma xenopodis TaxID=117903 RepID=A0A3S5CK63_9PLAT|nr:unnamed protein product [Protopolystoma xenopodis]
MTPKSPDQRASSTTGITCATLSFSRPEVSEKVEHYGHADHINNYHAAFVNGGYDGGNVDSTRPVATPPLATTASMPNHMPTLSGSSNVSLNDKLSVVRGRLSLLADSLVDLPEELGQSVLLEALAVLKPLMR